MPKRTPVDPPATTPTKSKRLRTAMPVETTPAPTIVAHPAGSPAPKLDARIKPWVKICAAIVGTILVPLVTCSGKAKELLSPTPVANSVPAVDVSPAVHVSPTVDIAPAGSVPPAVGGRVSSSQTTVGSAARPGSPQLAAIQPATASINAPVTFNGPVTGPTQVQVGNNNSQTQIVTGAARRVATIAARQELASVLRVAAPERFAVVTGFDNETHDLGMALFSALALGGWMPSDPPAVPHGSGKPDVMKVMPTPQNRGVTLYIPSAVPAAVTPGTGRLLEWLMKYGFQPHFVTVPPNDNKVVTIEVGDPP